MDKVKDVIPRTSSGAPDFDVFRILVVPFQLLTPAWLQGSLISGSWLLLGLVWLVCMYFVQMPSFEVLELCIFVLRRLGPCCLVRLRICRAQEGWDRFPAGVAISYAHCWRGP